MGVTEDWVPAAAEGILLSYDELVARVVKLSYRSDAVNLVAVEIATYDMPDPEVFNITATISLFSPLSKRELEQRSDDLLSQTVFLIYARGCIRSAAVFEEPVFYLHPGRPGASMVFDVSLEIVGVPEQDEDGEWRARVVD